MAVRHRWLMVVALTFFASPSAGQEVVARLKGDGLEERFTREAPVSGRVIAGVLAGSSSASDRLALYASHARTSDDICVRVLSRDGLYWSENTFTWPVGAEALLVPLEYQSRYQQQLSGYSEQDLAILAYEGDCRQATAGTALVAARGKNDNEPDSLTLLINSGRSDTFAVLTNLQDGPLTHACEAVEAGRRTGYDRVCRLPLAGRPDSGLLEIRIMRRRFDRMMPATELTVQLPGRANR